MSLRTSANRYAKALFEVALEEKSDLAQVDRDLASMVDLINTNAELNEAVTRMGIPDAARRALLTAVAEKMAVAAPVKKMIALLAEQRKLDRLPDLARAFRERLLAHQNVVHAEVTSAAPLSPEKTTALAAGLSRATGKQVDLSVVVDPELLGGIVARIGSTVYDGSVRTQLRKVREQLLAKN
ncbi:MAG: ATP synthase F1 subunit delta [Vicinamibacterales bacterium]